MKNLGQYRVWLTGSRMTIKRVVYQQDDGKYVVKWYGNMIEVKRGADEYYTVEEY